MDPIERVVKRARSRLSWNRIGGIIARALVPLLVFACLLIVVDKLLFVGRSMWYLLALAALAAAGVAAWFCRLAWPGPVETAVELDERLRLSERISSALLVAESGGAMERAVVEDAHAYAKSVPVARTFPLKIHRGFYIAFALAAAAIALLAWMPQFDLLARQQKMVMAKKEKEAVKRQATQMRRELKKIRRDLARLKKARDPKTLKRIDGHLEKVEKAITKMEKGKIKRPEAMARMAELSESIRKERKDAAKRALSSDAVARMANLDMIKKLAQNLANKDFASAKSELKKLASKKNLDRLSPRDLAKLKRQMSQLAKSLGQCDELCESMSELASKLGEADADDLEKLLEQADFSMDELAQIEEELDILANCQGMCEGCRSGLGGCKGRGSTAGIYTDAAAGKPGSCVGKPAGGGGKAPVEPVDVGFKSGKIRGKMRPGRMVGSFFVNGKQIRGEARAEYARQVGAARMEAAEALEQEQIPRAYEDYVREYFNQMKTE